ncbi:leucine-rich repeat receptor-like serine/threonine-protein kinase SKM1 [Ziziphus jujuba]|uniref:Leucine-rich repeat receptor-like serine/threonine-protein kinase SKM1 n=1 Tax=Ziziphus jujuba TaxID=326968 RepID=A0ABM3IN15_ZIZJJ|nr:leucine-rich repeat receptor-like serine/threonine-protein kinase SKM1 [Ziziphus jujuba]
MKANFELKIMAKRRTHQSCPILFMSMLLIFLFANTCALHGDDDDDELHLLLSFKASINDPLHSLSDWNPSSNDFCKWQGITCNSNTTSSRINTVELSGKNISGKVSAAIFQFPGIQTIDLSSNQLSGELPWEMFSVSSSLRFLNLSNNNLTGPIPSGSISHLETLDLSNNMLSGKIPPHIGSFWSLKFLDLGGNVLVGNIPTTITNISGLQYLTLASNQLVGQIPRQLGVMKSLKWIYLGYNNLSGPIPIQIGELNSLNHLDLVYNNLTGNIPDSIGNLTQLQYLFLYKNKLTGSIPRSVFGLKKLISLDLSDNFLSGEIPEAITQLQELEILHLFSNGLTGEIPSALASLPRLQVLQLWANKLSGQIPKDLGKRNNLTVLDLSTNSLTGNIPESLCASARLFKLILFSNSLTGFIPNSLSTCNSLRRVRLQNNMLSGELSPGFTKLPLVYFLDISANNLSGRIDALKWDMPGLQMLNMASNKFFGNLPESFGSDVIEDLDLSDNGFSGQIPTGFRNLADLMQLKLSHNKLSGPIPEELSSCEKLVLLDVSHNQLSGQIPARLSEMPVLGLLDLSENQLSGEIPKNLGGVESLVQVNISNNHFHGSLPSTGAFLAINASAVAGNDLCGGEAMSGLPPCKSRSFNHPTWWFLVFCSLLAAVVVAVAAVGFVFVLRRKDLELKRVENEDGIWEIQFFESKASRSITIEDILSSAKEGNAIAMARNGSVSYRGKSVLNGTQFVVKEMNDVNSISPSFWSEIVQFGKLRHPNIIKMIGICRSQKTGHLVYEYCEGKLLSEILRNLSWERRRKIATGIANALRFLHCYCSQSFVGGHVSPEKVIVDGNDEPRLCLTLPGLVCTDSKSFSYSAYVSPEASEGGITEKSDIYGFGLTLIELLTGKSPADTEFGVHESFVEWARYCYSDCHLDMWIDPTIRGHASDNQNELVETMNIALHCTAGDPTARPCADELYRTLQSVLSRGSCISGLTLSSKPL